MDEIYSGNSKARIVEAWAKGWAIARSVTPPVREYEGFRIDPGWPDQLRRYIFAEPNAGFKALAREIHEPWIFLKVCAARESVEEWLPASWTIRELRFMMLCFKPMRRRHSSLPGAYALSVEENPLVSVVRVMHKSEVAAIGRVAVVDAYAIYDRIETLPQHRRLGLASHVMLELEAIAAKQGGTKGVLVATAEGKNLYEKLGWETYSDYTTAVIPGNEE